MQQEEERRPTGRGPSPWSVAAASSVFLAFSRGLASRLSGAGCAIHFVARGLRRYRYANQVKPRGLYFPCAFDHAIFCRFAFAQSTIARIEI